MGVVRLGKGSDYSTVDGNYPIYLRPDGFDRLRTQTRLPGGRASAPPFLVSRLARRSLAALRLCRSIQAGQLSDQGVTATVGIIRYSA